jgi:hypothetical protein
MGPIDSMQTTIVNIPTKRITDWNSFHDVFSDALGFPGFYGRNLNAWVDCMISIDDGSSRMSDIFVNPGELLALRIDEAPDFARRCPEQYQALVECVTFVNYCRVEVGGSPVLALLLSGREIPGT